MTSVISFFSILYIKAIISIISQEYDEHISTVSSPDPLKIPPRT